MAKKRIGLMGCGVVAGYGHLPTLRDSTRWDLWAIMDPNPERLQAAKDRFGVERAFSDSDAFFQSGIDAVSIASPAPCHYQNVMDAIRYGKPVMCEKPLSQTEEEGEEMVRKMKEANLPLFTGYCYRFSPVSLKIKELVDQKAIGEVRSLRLVYVWNCHGRYTKLPDGTLIEQQRRVDRMLEGGPMVDCGVHQIDLARWWLGSEIVASDSWGAWVEDYEAPDHQYLHIDHANGAHTMVELSYTYCHTVKEPIHHFFYDLIGTDGLIRFDSQAKTFEVRNSSGTTQIPLGPTKNFAGMYDEFADAVETGKQGNLPTGEDGLIATRIARQSVEQAIQRRAAK